MDFSAAKIFKSLEDPRTGPLVDYRIPATEEFRRKCDEMAELSRELLLPENYTEFVEGGNPFPAKQLAERDFYLLKSSENPFPHDPRGIRFSDNSAHRLELYQRWEGMQMGIAREIAKLNFPDAIDLQDQVIADIMFLHSEYDERKLEILEALNPARAEQYLAQYEKHEAETKKRKEQGLLVPGSEFRMGDVTRVSERLQNLSQFYPHFLRMESANIARYLGERLVEDAKAREIFGTLPPHGFLMWVSTVLSDLETGKRYGTAETIDIPLTSKLDHKFYEGFYSILRNAAYEIFPKDYADTITQVINAAILSL